MKKIIALTLALIMSLSCFSVVSFAEETDNGTTKPEEVYIEVYDVEDLYCVRNDLTANYILMNDIDLTGATAAGGDWDFNSCGWDPIGSGGIYDDNAFSGVFDGNGHSITGLRIELNSVTSDTYDIYVGLFGYVTGTVKNLTVEGSFGGTLNRSTYPCDIYIGSIAGYNVGSIENCISMVDFDMSFSHTYTSNYSSSYGYFDINVGGISGSSRGKIKHCVNSGNINIYAESKNSARHYAYIGGITGENFNTVSECLNSADLISLESYINISGYKSYACGIAYNGCYTYNSSKLYGKIIDCYNMADVTVKNHFSYSDIACGIGYNYVTVDDCKISNCYNIGNVSGISGSYNYAIGNSYLTDCYYLSGTGTNTSGAVALTSAQLKLQSIFKGWDFENVWTMEGSNDYYYPELRNAGLIMPFTAKLSVEGEYITGSTLTATVSDVSPENAKYTVEWLVDGKVVATGDTYKIKYSDQGKTVSVRVNGGDSYTGSVTFTGETVAVAEHEHTPVDVDAVNPTCTENGYTSGVRCSDCGDIIDGCEIIEADGHNEVEIKAVEATCTKSGLTNGKRCKICGEITVAQQIVKSKGHTEVYMDAYKEPTCSEEGSTEGKKCSVCGVITVKPKPIEKVTHTYGEWEVTKEPSCDTFGEKATTCLTCSDTVYEMIEKKEHNSEIIPAVMPTCTVKGSTEGKKCKDCGAVIVASEIVDALGHDYVMTSESYEPSCINEGTYYFECTRCDSAYKETLKTKGHSFVFNILESKAATCTESGVSYFNCTACEVTDIKTIAPYGHNLAENQVCLNCGESHEHTYGEWFISKTPTCAAAGLEIAYCTGCNNSITRGIAPLEHDFDYAIDVAPTCTEKGHYYKKNCRVCKVTIEEQGNVPALGHEWQDYYTVIMEPTCVYKGKEAILCERCHATDKSSEKDIAQLPHLWSENYITLEQATCTKEGKMAICCMYCASVKAGTEEVIGKAPHYYKNGWQLINPATCTQMGISIAVCSDCMYIATKYDVMLNHADVNGDNKCDMCLLNLAPSQPDVPDTPNTPDNPVANCSCNCHKSGLSSLIWKILVFFYKIFGSNKTCNCGATHY